MKNRIIISLFVISTLFLLGSSVFAGGSGGYSSTYNIKYGIVSRTADVPNGTGFKTTINPKVGYANTVMLQRKTSIGWSDDSIKTVSSTASSTTNQYTKKAAVHRVYIRHYYGEDFPMSGDVTYYWWW